MLSGNRDKKDVNRWDRSVVNATAGEGNVSKGPAGEPIISPDGEKMKTLRYIMALLVVSAVLSACASISTDRNVRRLESGQETMDRTSAMEMTDSPVQEEAPADVAEEAEESESDVAMQEALNYESGSDTSEDNADNSGGEESGSEGADSGSGGDDEGGESNATDTGSDLIPEGWPEYVPIMEGFNVRYAGSDEAGMQVVAMSREIPSEDVELYYRQLEGWETEPPRVAPRAQTGPGGEAPEDAISFQLTREHEILTVNIVKGQQETILQLMYTTL